MKERGTRLHAGEYVVIALRNDQGGPRAGFTVSSQVGGAVVRNRVKRWLREAFRSVAPALPSFDVVFIARAAAPKAGIAGARRAAEAARRALQAAPP